jgi:NAD(P)H-nitrite reductase large subunit
MTRRYVIIGGGPAAIAAAGVIYEEDAAGQVLIIGDDPNGFYSRPGLAYYINGEIRDRELLLRHAANFQFVKAKVTAVDALAHQVTLENSSKYNYHRLLLATGSLSTQMSIPGAGLEGVVKLDDMEDAKKIIKLVGRSKTAVVTGGGITALEIVEALASHGVETHFIMRGERYWYNVLDVAESAIVERLLKNKGVRLYHRSQLSRILDKHGKVAAVETEDGKKISCQMVAMAIGVQPRIELARSAGLKTDRGIITDEWLQTSAPDIFAAGDVAQVFDPHSGKTTLEMLWGKALAQGKAAGKNMGGRRIPYVKDVPFNVTRLAGLTTTIIGAVGNSNGGEEVLSVSRGESETWRHLPNTITVQCDFDFNRTRILVGVNTIAGAVVMGDQTLSRPLHQLIARRVDISHIRPRLLAPGASLVDTIIEFWSDWNRFHEAS